MGAQPLLGLFRLAGGLQLGLGREQVVLDAQQGEVGRIISIMAATRGCGTGEPFAFGRLGIGTSPNSAASAWPTGIR
jgi:hypothetical protein